jgi:hypothetical protein
VSQNMGKVRRVNVRSSPGQRFMSVASCALDPMCERRQQQQGDMRSMNLMKLSVRRFVYGTVVVVPRQPPCS